MRGLRGAGVGDRVMRPGDPSRTAGSIRHQASRQATRRDAAMCRAPQEVGRKERCPTLTRWIRSVSVPLGLALGLFLISQALAAEVKPAGLPQGGPREAPGDPMLLVGTVIALVPDSRTIMVDVPLAQDALRLGGTMPETARITLDGAPAELDALTPGTRVRIEFRRTLTGNEATAVELLRGTQG